MFARSAARGRGFTYLGVMFIVAVLAMTSAMASAVWSTVQRRENERELVFVGRQFQAAIERYRQRSKGTTPQSQYPRRLEDLLRDVRVPQVERDLRQLYPDPITGHRQWGLIQLPGGGIVGVHSLSSRVPLQRSLLASRLAFPQAMSYRDWRFVAPSAVALLAAAPQPDAAAPGAVPANPSLSAADPATVTPADESADAPPAVAPRPSQQDYRARTPEACSRIAAYDQQSCLEQAARVGEEAGRECQDSALARTLACSLGDEGPLPALATRPN